MLTAQASALLERVQALTLRDVVVAALVITLGGAIAWIGWSVSRLRERLAGLDEMVARVDAAVAARCRNVELRQDRLQSRMENLGKDWRDSMRRTEERSSGELDLTKIEFRRP